MGADRTTIPVDAGRTNKYIVPLHPLMDLIYAGLHAIFCFCFIFGIKCHTQIQVIHIEIICNAMLLTDPSNWPTVVGDLWSHHWSLNHSTCMWSSHWGCTQNVDGLISTRAYQKDVQQLCGYAIKVASLRVPTNKILLELIFCCGTQQKQLWNILNIIK